MSQPLGPLDFWGNSKILGLEHNQIWLSLFDILNAFYDNI